MSLLHSLTQITQKSAKRVGRGVGSGKGSHTAGRGQKGQGSRKSGGVALWFEGGQLPLIKRLPMTRGKGRFKVVRPVAEVLLSEVDKMQADVITLDTLKLEKVIEYGFDHAKIIAGGSLNRAVTIQGIRVSQAARQAIEKAGGQVQTQA